MSYCPNCNAQLKNARICWNCDASFEEGSAWKPQARPLGSVRKFSKRGSPPSPVHQLGLTRMSLGKNLLARKFGNFLLIASAVFSLVALINGASRNTTDLGASLLAACFLLFFAFSIRCFLHGQGTWIHHQIKAETLADQTALRVLGLGIDTVFWCYIAFELKSW
jgi:hypothetical protein